MTQGGRVSFKDRPELSRVQKIAPHYKYNDKTPTTWTDVDRWKNFIKGASLPELRHLSGKAYFVKKLLAKRYYELRYENDYIKWYESGMPRTHSVPRYNTALIGDSQIRRMYTDRLLRFGKMSDPFYLKAKYDRLKEMHERSEKDFPPAMSGNDVWRNYFPNLNNLEKLNHLDECITTILNLHDSQVKQIHEEHKKQHQKPKGPSKEQLARRASETLESIKRRKEIHPTIEYSALDMELHSEQ